MKKILIATLLIGMISSCAKNQTKISYDKNGLPWNVEVFIWEKHQYVAFGNAGLVHSESCSNPIHKEKKSN